MRLRSKKVYLRAPERDDCDELIELYRSSRRHFRGLARSDFDREAFDKMLVDAAAESNRYFIVCRIDDGSIVGTVNLSQIFRKAFQNVYLGYQTFAGHTRKGYMTEAVALALRFAFTDLGLHRVEANVQPGNIASIRILERNSFSKEGFSRRYLKIAGRWRDHERWAILKEDWLANRENGRNGRTNRDR